MSAKRQIFDTLKNIPGWRTGEKLVVIAVDDYGNVRLDSASARKRLHGAGLDMTSRFDQCDALETRQDLEALYETLESVKDRDGGPAVFTPYTLCANPDFDSIARAQDGYIYESLPQTVARLASSQPQAYEGAWKLLHEGVRLGLLRPQFHGREHLNVKLFEQKLNAGHRDILVNIENRSMAAVGRDQSLPGVGFTHAFGLWNRSEIDFHREIIKEGLLLFEVIFGFKSTTFTPPAQKIHPDIYPDLDALGVTGIFKPRWCRRRIDQNRYAWEFNLNEVSRRKGHLSLVRNVVFEPTSNPNTDSASLALDQISAAFRLRKPAIISSHRVNFSGHIDPENRRYGLQALKRLQQSIVRRWPDVRFIGADEFVHKIEASRAS